MLKTLTMVVENCNNLISTVLTKNSFQDCLLEKVSGGGKRTVSFF